jgi:hypothetical protein
LEELFAVVRVGGDKTKDFLSALGADAEVFIFIQAALKSGTIEDFAKNIEELKRAAITPRGDLSKQMAKLVEDAGDLVDKRDPFELTNKEKIERIKNEQAILSIQKSALESQAKTLQLQGEHTEKSDKLKLIRLQISAIINADKDLQNQILDLQAKENRGRIQALIASKKLTAEELERYNIKLDQKTLALALKDIDRDTQRLLETSNAQLNIRKLLGAQEREIRDTQVEQLEIQKKGLEQKQSTLGTAILIGDNAEKHKDVTQQIVVLENKILLIKKQQEQEDSAIARWRAEMAKLDVNSIAEAFNKPGAIIDTGLGAAMEAGQQVIKDITSLWKEQREEAAQLEVELERLQAAYAQALNEGNVEQARQLAQQMAATKDRIDELEDPIKNLANTFREFALSVVEELQKIIIKMLVIKALKFALGGATGGGFAAFDQLFASGGFLGAKGGVMPGGTFKTFRRFASGGVTGGAGMAILGDNPSGKELVIPSENIKNDEVEGFTRSKEQPINIVNILTEQDIAKAMASVGGQRVIVNTIGADLGKRGPIYRAIRT